MTASTQVHNVKGRATTTRVSDHFIGFVLISFIGIYALLHVSIQQFIIIIFAICHFVN